MLWGCLQMVFEASGHCGKDGARAWRQGPVRALYHAPGPSAAEVYKRLLAADPALGLAALEKKLKLRKAMIKKRLRQSER